MIDIHAHILPGIDDGAEDMYDTLEMARMAADSGVNRIIATPHCNIPGMYGNYFGREYIDRYESVVRAVRKEKIPIEILPGMEVFSRARGYIPPGIWYVLDEAPDEYNPRDQFLLSLRIAPCGYGSYGHYGTEGYVSVPSRYGSSPQTDSQIRSQ